MQALMQAIYDVVDEHGTKKIAEGASFTSRTLLAQKANPDYDSHNMNVPELDRIMAFTRDFRPLSAWADRFDFDLVARKRPSPKPLIVSLSAVSAEYGDVARFIVDALADSFVSRGEKVQGDRIIQEVIDALHVLRESLKAA
ncbi:phage regulatory CII family protein [Pseudomonas kulmbachensis]|uniref:Phage regulatory CII family protein n=1 Tax=Pseudomonas kulmbachensis TaxID=3043408 RepID=A0ABW7LT80_9PSED|nr:phage regulatory CII family protein [Pseudomonas sp. V3/3/4/13]